MRQELLEQLIEALLSAWSADFSDSLLGIAFVLVLYGFAEGVAYKLKGEILFLAPLATVRRAVAEIRYLRSLRRSKRLKRWKRRYVALQSLTTRDEVRKAPEEPILKSLLAAVAEREKLVVLGEPGSGKSTAMEALAFQLATAAYRQLLLVWGAYGAVILGLSLVWTPFALIGLFGAFAVERLAIRSALPVFVEVRLFTDGGMEEFLAKSLTGRVGGETIYRSMRFYTESGRLALIVDGINEMRWEDYNSVLYAWRECLVPGHYVALTSVLFTSRLRKDPSGILGIDKVLTIQELSDHAVRVFLRKDGERDVESAFNSLLQNGLLDEGGFGRNPYWLQMISQSGEYRPNQAAVLEKFCRRVIKRELQKKRSARPFQVDQVLGYLASMARSMTEACLVGASLGAIKSLLAKEIAEKQEAFDVAEFLDFAQATNLLRVSHRDERVEFSHHIVQEFFTAYGLRQTPEVALEHLDEAHWWQSLVLLGALVEDRRELLKTILGDRNEVSRILLAIILLETQAEPAVGEEEDFVEILALCLGRGLSPEQRETVVELARIAPLPVTRALEFQIAQDDRAVQQQVLQLALDLGGELGASLVCKREVLESEALLESACEVLTEIGPECGPTLVDLLGEGLVLPELIEVLQKVGDRRITVPLLELLAQEPAIDPRILLKLLGEIHDPEAIESLLEMLDMPRWSSWHGLLVEILGQWGDPRAASAIRKIRRTAEPLGELHRSATRALQQIGDVQTIAPALEGLRSDDWVERESARDTLRDVCGPGSVPALIAALKDPSWVVRGEVATLLGELGDPRAAPPLRLALWDQDPRVRRRVAAALGELEDHESAEELERVVTETERSEVVYAAREALKRLRVVA